MDDGMKTAANRALESGEVLFSPGFLLPGTEHRRRWVIRARIDFMIPICNVYGRPRMNRCEAIRLRRQGDQLPNRTTRQD